MVKCIFEKYCYSVGLTEGFGIDCNEKDDCCTLSSDELNISLMNDLAAGHDKEVKD